MPLHEQSAGFCDDDRKQSPHKHAAREIRQIDTEILLPRSSADGTDREYIDCERQRTPERTDFCPLVAALNVEPSHPAPKICPLKSADEVLRGIRGERPQTDIDLFWRSLDCCHPAVDLCLRHVKRRTTLHRPLPARPVADCSDGP